MICRELSGPQIQGFRPGNVPVSVVFIRLYVASLLSAVVDLAAQARFCGCIRADAVLTPLTKGRGEDGRWLMDGG